MIIFNKFLYFINNYDFPGAGWYVLIAIILFCMMISVGVMGVVSAKKTHIAIRIVILTGTLFASIMIVILILSLGGVQRESSATYKSTLCEIIGRHYHARLNPYNLNCIIYFDKDTDSFSQRIILRDYDISSTRMELYKTDKQDD